MKNITNKLKLHYVGLDWGLNDDNCKFQDEEMVTLICVQADNLKHY